MKTNRDNGRKQYTISIPHTIQQILQGEQLYITRDNNTPGIFHIHNQPTNQEQEKQRSIFPNGKQKYFTLPVKFLKDMKPEQINEATFIVNVEELENISVNIT